MTVFCVHDADAAGTMIYQTFQEATKARGARKIKIVNLGLEPWEALAMGLQSETVKESDGKYRPVADYIEERDRRARRTAATWAEWLQTNRIELNAMTDAAIPRSGSTQDGAARHDQADPADKRSIAQELHQRVEDKIGAAITARVLREAHLDDQVAAAVAAIEPKEPGGAELAKGIERMFEREQDRQWRDHVEAVAARLTKRRF